LRKKLMKTISIGNLTFGDAPRIAVPLYDDDPAGDVAAIRGLADLIELRIDCFADASERAVCEVIRQMRAAGAPPLIGTVRWSQEGGRGPFSDGERAALYEAITPLVDAVDVEMHSPLRDRVVERARAAGKTTIASFHDFAAMPAFYDIEALVDEADAAGVDILKVAAAAASLADVRHLLEFTLRHRDRGLVTIALGEVGAVSRVFFPLAGSLFTFAHHRTPSGPGQLPLPQMRAELDRYYKV
jgi:3-dehydroquinate dehydratase I